MQPPPGRPEDRARTEIDRLLTAAGWLIQNRDNINIEAGRGIAIREFLLAVGYGVADYLLYVDGCAAGVVEAKKAGLPLTEVELQTGRYSLGLPPLLPAPRRPLPFCDQSPASKPASPISSNPRPEAARLSRFIVRRPSPRGWKPISNPPVPGFAIFSASCLRCGAKGSGITSTAATPKFPKRWCSLATIATPTTSSRLFARSWQR